MDFLRDSFLRVLSAGPVPKHIGFVMDGNRRFARKNNKPVQEGHDAGFRTLKTILEICLKLGVQCVTVYAFSIENFKRSAAEVDALMALAESKIQELCEQEELLSKYSVRLNVIGRKGLLPTSLQKVIADAEDLTSSHNKAILNICMPYTSQDEIATSVQKVVQEADDSDGLAVHEITTESIGRNLETNSRGSPPLDILVRTSGVQRFSDFLLWQQSDDTQICFTPTYWPDFGLLDVIPILFDYQRKVWSGSIRKTASDKQWSV